MYAFVTIGIASILMHGAHTVVYVVPNSMSLSPWSLSLCQRRAKEKCKD